MKSLVVGNARVPRLNLARHPAVHIPQLRVPQRHPYQHYSIATQINLMTVAQSAALSIIPPSVRTYYLQRHSSPHDSSLGNMPGPPSRCYPPILARESRIPSRVTRWPSGETAKSCSVEHAILVKMVVSLLVLLCLPYPVEFPLFTISNLRWLIR